MQNDAPILVSSRTRARPQPAQAMLWLAPLLSFSVIVGIGLDYNVFLLVRVREYRYSGYYNTKDSVALGLERTGQ